MHRDTTASFESGMLQISAGIYGVGGVYGVLVQLSDFLPVAHMSRVRAGWSALEACGEGLIDYGGAPQPMMDGVGMYILVDVTRRRVHGRSCFLRRGGFTGQVKGICTFTSRMTLLGRGEGERA